MNWTRDHIDYIRKWGKRKSLKELEDHFGISKGAVTSAIKRFCDDKQITATLEMPLNRILRGATCKFLGGDSKPFTECNQPIVRGSYCEEHAKVCYMGKAG